eukprot:gene8945-10601_t
MDTDDNKCIDEQEYAIVLAQYQVVNADLEARTAAGPSNPPPWQNQSPDRRRRVLSAGNSCAGVNVTFRTVTKGHAYEISWYIDDDCKAGTLYGTSFASFAVRDTFCCRNTTVADVRCLDSYGDGWHGAYLEGSWYATTYFADAVQTTSVSTILLRTSVQLTAALTEVARPLTINGSCPNATGQRCIVDAAYRARLFDVAEGGSLRLEGLTLCGGYSAERGGGVQLAALAALHLERCVLRGCRAGSYGGGVAIDFYGNLTSLGSASGFVVVTSDTATLRGQTTAEYDPQLGAEVSMLTVTGEPGQGFSLVFSPSQEQWAQVVLPVTLVACAVGEQYIDEAGAQRCKKCGEGSIKFSNSTAPCASCTEMDLHEDALDCLGGSQQWAARGGGVFLGAMAVPAERISMHRLGFEYNEAVGENIFWIHDANMSDADQPECLGCTHVPANASLLATSPVAFDIVQDGVKVSGGGVGTQSGGIYSDGGRTIAVDSALASNVADSRGGGIATSSGLNVWMELTTAAVTGNYAGLRGGGIFIFSLVDGMDRGFELYGSVVARNEGARDGGGVWCDGFNATVIDSAVMNNTARKDGGGVWIADATWRVTNASFEGNTAAEAGGGLHLQQASLWMRLGRVRGNRAATGGGVSHVQDSEVEIHASEVRKNVAASGGGGVFADGTWGVTVLSEGTCVEANLVEAGGGGGLEVYNGRLVMDIGSAVRGNVASGGHGGGVAGIAGAIVIERSVISFGFAGEGGGVYSTAYSRVQGGTCESHGLGHITRALECGLMRHGVEGVEEEVVMTARAGYPLGCFLQRGMEEQELLVVNEGGAGGCSSELQCFCRGVGTLLVTATQVVENEASLSGGGLWVDFALNLSAHSVVSENHAAQVGGGVYAYNYTAITLQNRSEVVGNTAVSYRNLGGIYGETGVTVSVDNDSYVDSYTLVAAPPLPPPPPPPPLPPPLPASPSAPPVQVTNGTAVIMDPEPTYATAQLASVLEDPTVHTVLLLVNITLTASLPALAGRALTISGACGAGPCLGGSSAHLANTSLRGCSAALHGGGVYANGSTVTLSGSVVEGCAAGFSGGGWFGEASHTDGVMLTMTASVMGNNTAMGQGGRDTGQGGGLHCSGLNARTDNVRVLAGSEVRGNSAARNGGGIYIHRTCVLSVEASSVTGNVAGSGGEGGNGGGVAVSAATLTISGASAVSFNWARGEFGFELENMDYGRGGHFVGMSGGDLIRGGGERVPGQVYACAIPSRCESEEPHASAGNLSNLFDTALCAHGSRRDTVLCAGCDIHFFVGVDDQCTECPDAASTLTTAAGCLLGLVLLVAAARAGLHGYLGNSELQAQLLSARILAQLRGPDKSGILLSVLIGHIQIMAQTLTLFPANIVPDNYERFLGATEPFNLSVFSWLPVSCLTTALGMSYRVETYYWTLAFYASLPVLFSIPIVMSVLRARRLAAVEKGNALRPKIARLASVMSAPGAECSAMTELSLAATWAGGAVDEDTPALVRAVIDQGKETGQEDDAEARSSMTVVNPILRTLSEAQQDLPIGRSSSVNPRLLVRSESATATDRRRQERARTIRMEVEEGAMEAEVHSEEGDYWLEMDHQVECYTFRWYIFRLVALLTIVIYILGLPVVLAVAPYVLRKYKRMRVKQSGAIIYVDQGGLQQDPDDPPEAFFMAEQATGRRVALEAQYEEKEGQRVVMTALHHPEAKLLLQYHLMPFKEHYFYWAAYDMGRKLAQTSVVLLVQEVDSQYDLLYSACLTTIALALHAQTRPYKIHIVNIFQTFVLVGSHPHAPGPSRLPWALHSVVVLAEVSQTLTISMLMGQRYASSDFGSSVVGIVAVILQVLLTGTMFAIIAVDMVRANWPTLAFLARTAADTAAVALRRAVACIHRRKHDTGHTAPKPIVARA